MTPPFARPIDDDAARPAGQRRPRAFAPDAATDLPATVEVLSETDSTFDPLVPPRKRSWPARIAWAAGSLLVTMALGLAAERLVADLFATQAWLGWLGLGVLGVLVVALVALGIREVAALWRLQTLDRLRDEAAAVLLSDVPAAGAAVSASVAAVYAGRPDLARPLQQLSVDRKQVFDGAEHVRLAERLLLSPLDAKAKALTAASARRVALVTTVSPRALVDIAFVVYESVRLGGAIARLYGARPGLFGTLRLMGAILAHLAVTGGLVLTDGVVEQLVGQGLAAKLSARLGEGVVNGLMTVRVGIAAMRVVRPLPYATQRAPMVKDFVPELGNVLNSDKG